MKRPEKITIVFLIIAVSVVILLFFGPVMKMPPGAVGGLSLAWLIISGAWFAYEISVRPFDNRTWMSVVVGVCYTFVGGVGINFYFSAIKTPQILELPQHDFALVLLAPWLSFWVTGAIMISAQLLKEQVANDVDAIHRLVNHSTHPDE